ncbi:MAG: hypothetical protein FWB72_01515 [Firmicutes bacterium]|nr:hypothetical protein [Bacillota bacterium]
MRNKVRICLVFALMLISALVLVACGGSGNGNGGGYNNQPQLTQVNLGVPQNLAVNANTLVATWDEVENTSAFNVRVNETEYDTSTNSINLALLDLPVGENEISVRAAGRVTAYTNYVTSAFSEVVTFIVVPMPDYTIPTDLVATFGDTLGEIDLPSGWAWYAGLDTLVGGAGQRHHYAVYTSADPTYDPVTRQVAIYVERAVLTVTAVDASRVFGGENPQFTYTLAGFVAGDSYDIISGAFAIGTNALVNTGVGAAPEYRAITVSAGTAVAQNYTFYFVAATLTITRASLRFEANAASREFGAENPQFTYTITGFVAGDTRESAVTGAVVLSTNATATTSVAAPEAERTITLAGGTISAANYSFSFVSAILTITRATPQYIIPTDLVGVEANTLADITLLPRWAWYGDATTAVGVAGNRLHYAVYTPADYVNFVSVRRAVSIYVRVGPVEANPQSPTDLVGYIEAALSSVALPARWAWEAPTTPLGTTAANRMFWATYTPENTVLYLPTRRQLTVSVMLLVPVTQALQTNITGVREWLLGQIELPPVINVGHATYSWGGWTWADGNNHRLPNVSGEIVRQARWVPGGSAPRFRAVYKDVTIKVGTIVYVSVGLNATLALDSNGGLWVWGVAESGVLGTGGAGNVTLPRRIMNVYSGTPTSNQGAGAVMPAPAFRAVSTHHLTSAAIDTDGRLWTWGRNINHAIGQGNIMGAPNDNILRPSRITQVLNAQGNVSTAVPAFVQVSLGREFGSALCVNGSIWTWGNNADGRTGLGFSSGTTQRPRLITNIFSDSTDVHSTAQATAPRWEQVSAGDIHMLAIAGGRIYSWGANVGGGTSSAGDNRLGLGTEDIDVGTRNRPRRIALVWQESTSPVATEPSARVNFTQISAGTRHNLALDDNNRVWSWGTHANGRTGFGVNSGNVAHPRRVMQMFSAATGTGTASGNLFDVISVSAGYDSSVILRGDGQRFVWGSNAGNTTGDINNTTNTRPRAVGIFPNATMVSQGSGGGALIDANGSVYTWGTNTQGGHGGTATINQPTRIRPTSM